MPEGICPDSYRGETMNLLFISLGCDKNLVDSEVMLGIVEKDGYTIVDCEEDADIIVINTCCFIYDAKEESIQTIFLGVLRHVIVRVGFKTEEIMVTLVTRTHEIPNSELLIQRLVSKYPKIKSIAQNVNPKVTNVIFGDETRILYGESYIYDEMNGIRFAISPRSFYQVNPIQTETLYSKAVEYAQLSGNEIVFDAYCGIGTITLFLAQHAKQVYGVEIIPEAIEDAKMNARLNGFENTQFAVGKSEEIIPAWIENGIVPDVIVVDPPRKGCDRSLLDTMLEAAPDRIVYVSCDSSTLARDLRVLIDGGYKLEVVQPVDMFPQTAHIECVAKLVRA